MPGASKYRLAPDWENAVDGWLRWMTASGIAKRSKDTRRSHVRSAARELDLRHPKDVCTQRLVALFATQPHWAQEHKRGVRCSLVQFYDWCMQVGLTDQNPARGLPQIAESQPKPRPAPEWLWEEILQRADPRTKMMIRLAGEAGLRREEVCKVHRDDVIWDGDGWSLIVHGKGDKQRIVPITDSLAEAIQRGPTWTPPGYPTKGYLFPSYDQWGNPVALHMSADRVGRLVGEVMGPDWSMHKLRHRFATRGFAGTKNLRAVQEALGHASVATTQRYVAVSSPDLRAVSEAVASRGNPSSRAC
jgi:integrase